MTPAEAIRYANSLEELSRILKALALAAKKQHKRVEDVAAMPPNDKPGQQELPFKTNLEAVSSELGRIHYHTCC